YTGYSESWQVDISDNQLTITDVLENGFPFFPADFNGFVLTVISGPDIISASADPSSGFSPVSITIEGGNRLLLNYVGVQGGPGGLTSIIDFTTSSAAAPEADP